MAFVDKKGVRFYQRQGPKASETPAPPLGACIRYLNKEDLSSDSTAFRKTAVITNCSLVTSYNWLDGKTNEPTILVPGKKISCPQNFAIDKETQASHRDGPHRQRQQNCGKMPGSIFETKMPLDIPSTLWNQRS